MRVLKVVNYVSDREGRSRFCTATFMCSILRTSARRGFATNGGSSSNVDKLEEAFKYSGLADFLAAAATHTL